MRKLVFFVALMVIVAAGCSTFFIKSKPSEEDILNKVIKKCTKYYPNDYETRTLCVKALFEREKKMKGL